MTKDTDAEVREVLSALEAAMHARDAGAATALHDPKALIFDLAPPLGKGPDEAELAQWLASWAGPVSERWHELRVETSGDLALCYGYVRVEAPTAGESAEWWMRRTVGLRRGPEGWRIVHDHASVPFYMDGSNRAALDLTPEET